MKLKSLMMYYFQKLSGQSNLKYEMKYLLLDSVLLISSSGGCSAKILSLLPRVIMVYTCLKKLIKELH